MTRRIPSLSILIALMVILTACGYTAGNKAAPKPTPPKKAPAVPTYSKVSIQHFQSVEDKFSADFPYQIAGLKVPTTLLFTSTPDAIGYMSVVMWGTSKGAVVYCDDKSGPCTHEAGFIITVYPGHDDALMEPENACHTIAADYRLNSLPARTWTCVDPTKKVTTKTIAVRSNGNTYLIDMQDVPTDPSVMANFLKSITFATI